MLLGKAERVRLGSRKHLILFTEGSIMEMELSLKRALKKERKKKYNLLIYNNNNNKNKSICFFEINRDIINSLQTLAGVFPFSLVYDMYLLLIFKKKFHISF